MNKENERKQYKQGFDEGFKKGHSDCLKMLIKILQELNKE